MEYIFMHAFLIFIVKYSLNCLVYFMSIYWVNGSVICLNTYLEGIYNIRSLEMPKISMKSFLKVKENLKDYVKNLAS